MINYTRKRKVCQVHPLLAQAAIREGYGRFYRAWVALRTTYAGRRRGWVYYKSACGILKRCLSLKSLKAAELILREGEPLFWQISKKKGPKVFLRGLRYLCENFHTPPGYPKEIPLEALKRLGTFKAFCYAAFFGEEERIISRETLSRLYGVSEQTLRNWERKTSGYLKKRKNYGFIARGSPLKWLGFLPPHFWIGRRGYEFCLPNSYSSTLAFCSGCSHAKSLYKAMKRTHAAAFCTHPLCLFHREGQCVRLYFRSTKGFNRAIQSGQEVIYILVKKRERLWQFLSGIR